MGGAVAAFIKTALLELITCKERDKGGAVMVRMALIRKKINRILPSLGLADVTVKNKLLRERADWNG